MEPCTLQQELKAHSTDARLIVLNTGTDRHDRNRKAQARYRERVREKHNRNAEMAQQLADAKKELAEVHAALQAERAAFAVERKRWQEPLQPLAFQPLQEFVLDPHRQSIVVLQRCKLANQIMPWITAKLELMQKNMQLLGWQDMGDLFTNDLCTVMVAWCAALKAAMRKLLAAHNAHPCKETLEAMAQSVHWQWGEPGERHYDHCVEAMELTSAQKTKIAEAYHKWQQKTTESQHQSAAMLSCIQSLQHRSTVHSKGHALWQLEDDKTSGGWVDMCCVAHHLQQGGQLLRQREAEEKTAALDLWYFVYNTLQPIQHVRMEVASQPYGVDFLRLCEAVEQSLARSSVQAASAMPSLQADSMLDEILATFDRHNAAGFPAEPWQTECYAGGGQDA
ncbi:hypothetical protein WJX73_008399 [Symbiochloris irregularis]|uniref:BZIP domain-containing protein n=1 Tax=Symbiochloris irregularis TaxID=706552 RepID=A0AAW1PNQ0_9CHLO